MEDKQIIYNCPHISLTAWGTYACKLYNPRDKNCLVKGGNCVSNISCPYKQFKRKEQECEELKIYIESNEQQVKYVETLVMDNDRLINELDQLKFDYAELEKRHNDSFEQFQQLKAENDELIIKNRILETECNEMRDVCDEFEQYYEHLMEGHKKLKQTLIEIGEIAEGKNPAFIDNDDVVLAILQKISEVEE